MNSYNTLSSKDFERLLELDTCAVSNAIERFEVRLRHEGFSDASIRCRFSDLPPMLGYAVTGRIRCSSPPISGGWYYDHMDWWRYVATIPEPRVIVMQDVDEEPGRGAWFGEIHARIGRALKVAGYVTNGSVRDLAAVRRLGFPLFSGSVSVSHAYAHVVEFGEPVEVGGLKVGPGDLLHGDRHGLQAIPISVAAEIPRMAAELRRTEQALIEFCGSPEFSLERLALKVRELRLRPER